eukprot:TRINITY_DN490_c0_g1_i2.p1 TRINITY_DN490_c0_g1~~TRINITY_DN490_c0_g1_i2.p1  ORF type:complete len:218 (-),score=45.07 TRINITY_DN490_c0_g1_i2:18-671(-)
MKENVESESTPNKGSEWPNSYKFPLSSHWDEDYHLVLDDNFYIPPIPNFEAEPVEEIGLNIESENMLEMMEDIPRFETESEVSTVASGSTTASLPAISIVLHFDSLDAQLDFIMETTKKHAKPLERKHRRSRKTPQQLKILIDELGDTSQNADKAKIKEVAAKVGLTELQVYKWYWDRKSKICSVMLNEHSLYNLSLIHICRCRRIERCRSRWSPYH